MKRSLLSLSMCLLLAKAMGTPIDFNATAPRSNHSLFSANSISAGVVQKLTITRDQAMTLTPQEETFMRIFDGNLTTPWFPGWGAMYPASTLIDLKGTFTITKFRFKNNTGDRRFKIYGGKDPFNLTVLMDRVIGGYDTWTEVTVSTDVKYLKFEIPVKTESPTEVEIYGAKIEDELIVPVSGTPRQPSNVNGILGVNSFHWVKPENETAFRTIREYVETEWIQEKDNDYRYNPSSRGDAMFDDHYAQLKSMGIEVMPCIKGTLPWTRTAEYQDSEFKPIYPLTANPADPKSYKEMAEFHFQFAARYGYTQVDASLLQINATPRWTADPINVKKTGLGYIKYFECWNESDKDWKGTKGYMTPYEFAAYISAVADGHCKTLGTATGIKNADPTAKVVMGGLANLSIDYVKAMVIWFKANRPDHSVPIDVFNFHHYSNSAGFQHTAGSYGITPEQDQIREKLKKIKAYVDANFPGKEVFLSEYGYDSNVGSVQRCEPIGTMSRTEVQGIWNTRTMLEYMASKIDKSYVYMMYDESNTEESWTVFGNCGMLTGYGAGSIKKPSWYYINTLKEVLRDYKFIADESPSASVRKYKFSKGTSFVYAIWLTSASDAKSTHSLSIPNSTTADIITLADKNQSGTKTTVAHTGTLSLNISERPLFVVVNTTSTITNKAPLANAGADLKITLPANTASLTGNGTDADGTITSYAWSKISGPSATLANGSTSILKLSNLLAGTYVFRLTVTDNNGSKATDDVNVTVTAAISVGSLVLVDADKDIDITPLTNNYTLNLAAYPCNFSFVAKTNPVNIGSVKFLWDGVVFKTVKGAPFSFTDNCYPGFNCYNAWWKPTMGTHTVTAIPYSGTDGTGTQGAPYSITFKVVNVPVSTARLSEESEVEGNLSIVASPNPVKDQLLLSFPVPVNNTKVELIDALGYSYYNESSFNGNVLELQMDGKGLNAGIYFVKINMPGAGVKMIKIVKE